MPTPSSDDLNLSKERREALMMLAHYYLARNKDGGSTKSGEKKPLSRTAWFDKLYAANPKWKAAAKGKDAALRELDARKQFYNFLNAASVQASVYVYKDLEKKMLQPGFYKSVAPVVQQAIDIAFEQAIARGRPRSATSETIRRITQEGEHVAGALLSEFGGLWDVIRFSAHGDQDHFKSHDPRVMRAVLQIRGDDGAEDAQPEFEIRYRPGKLVPDDTFEVSKGLVFVLGQGAHLLFFGWEDGSKYPLLIFATRDNGEKNKPIFFGLVIRRHEKGHIFASRVMFLRSGAKHLDELVPAIGMHRQSALLEALKKEHPKIQDFDTLLSIIVNTIGSEGRSGLWLTSEPPGKHGRTEPRRDASGVTP